jgi:ankyrin repeat protein
VFDICLRRERGGNGRIAAGKRSDVNATGIVAMTTTTFKFAVISLHVACSTGSTELVRLLIDNGADIDREMEMYGTSLQIAAEHKHWSVVQLLLQSGANFSPSVFCEAARNNRMSIIHGLLSDGVADLLLLPIALEAACNGQQLEVINFLLEEFTDTAFEEQAFYGAEIAACKMRNDTVLQLLLELDPSPSPEILAAANTAGLTGSVRILIQKGIDPNMVDSHNGHPLHIAAYYQRLDVVKNILKEGVDPNLGVSKYRDTIRSVLEERIAFQVLKLKNPHPLKDIALRLPQHQIYRILDWVEEIEISRKPIKTSESDVEYDVYTETRFSTFSVWIEDIDRSSKLIQILFDYGANPNSKTGLFGNYLHLAAFLGMDGARNPLNAVLEASGRIFSSAPTNPDLILELLLSRFKNLQITDENIVKAVKRTLILDHHPRPSSTQWRRTPLKSHCLCRANTRILRSILQPFLM